MAVRLKTNVDYKQIGTRIRQARLRAELSQEKLGKEAGNLSPTAISLYEQGERRVSLEVLSAIAKALDVTLEELVQGYAEEIPSIQVSLRSDSDLKGDKNTQQQILDFIEFIKQKRKQRSGR